MKNHAIKKNMRIIGADGVHIGTVDSVTASRIRLMKDDSGQGRHKGHHHYIDLGLVADIEGQTVIIGRRGHRRHLRGGSIGRTDLSSRARCLEFTS